MASWRSLSTVSIQVSDDPLLRAPETGVAERFRTVDLPIWDLAGQLAGKPVYDLVGNAVDDGPLKAPCYDTSLYMDDLHLDDDDDAITLMLANPTLIKRPILKVGSTLMIGFEEGEYNRVLGKKKA